MDKKTLRHIEVEGKRVLMRVDYNVPLKDGEITDDARIRASLPSINNLLDRNARLILVSHLGRPKGKVKEELRLDPVAERLELLLGLKVTKVNDVVGREAVAAVEKMNNGSVLLLENVRFEAGEEKNDPELAKKLAGLADFYVNDAFGAAHRAHASTEGVTHHIPSVAGLLMESEVLNLQSCLDEPKRPLTAIFGGAKVSDKIGVIKKFLETADYLLIGGAMSTIFLAAKGYDMADSFYEKSSVALAKELLKTVEQENKQLILPTDVIIVKELEEGATYRQVTADSIPAGWKSVDIGNNTIEVFSDIIKKSGMVLWNGPLGVFEIPPFHRGTEAVAQNAVESDAYVVVGGGDTAAAFEKFGLTMDADYVSTGGGASLEFLEGKPLPGITALQDK